MYIVKELTSEFKYIYKELEFYINRLYEFNSNSNIVCSHILYDPEQSNNIIFPQSNYDSQAHNLINKLSPDEKYFYTLYKKKPNSKWKLL